MGKYLKKNISLISFLFIPIVYFWDPNWLEFLGVQPYWPLFWLLPWSMIYGSFNGSIIGLFLGLILDSLSLDSSFTQILGLVLCGIWFGKLSISNNIFVGYFRFGLICSIASFFCGSLYFFQVLIKYWSNHNIFLYLPIIKNIFAQVFITGLLAPLICSLLFRLFQKSKGRYKLISFIDD
ncbi:hypothetical protein [Prochlorococcus sp.]|jgi:rod shape-determining protein MreD|uniref:hypothetical protein n=1 Tax=Prochlorococcus sp. TaxID=1220 RepID=UPI000DFBCC23|nr:MAG: hypothetical protein DBW86_00570 [Prochlorococcus sp. MED-G72]